jgi:phage tail sheath protein FI
MVPIGDDIYHGSTMFACEFAKCTIANGGIPYQTASNRSLPVSGAVLADGTPVYMTDQEANDLLNAHGITTFLNQGPRGTVVWGNRTAGLQFRSQKMMEVWLTNTIRLSMAQEVDQPGNYRQIESIVNSLNIQFNGWAATGAFVGTPKVEFRREDNPLTALADGQYKFHFTWFAPTPMESIIFVSQPDPSQLETLFSNV